MIRHSLIILILFVLICSVTGTGCSDKKDKDIKFNPVPEGTPTVNSGGGKVAKKIED
jgi:hypothetical protein